MSVPAIATENSKESSAKSLLVGVSLSNRSFDKRFTRDLIEWAASVALTEVNIIIFDELETVNYRVFRELGDGEAMDAAHSRGRELARMFEKVALAGELAVRVITQSQHPVTRSAILLGTRTRLLGAYSVESQFRCDVQRQVFTNLRGRLVNHQPTIITQNIDTLALYIIDELAFFYAYRVAYDPLSVEAYPGKELFVKRNLFTGVYHEETGLAGLAVEPSFVNVAFLCEDNSRDDSDLRLQ